MANFVKKRKGNQTIEYLNTPMAFDIETTSYTSNDKTKFAWMYEWTFGEGYENQEIIFGRTWAEFLDFYNSLVNKYNTNLQKRLVIYVHNLSFEFQFLRKLLQWEEVFAMSERKVLYCVTKEGIEFRCSSLLSGYSLAKLAENLSRHKTSKLVGDLDYEKIRTSKTPLTEKEWEYCKRDVEVILYYIGEQIEDCGDISKIPYTKTGYVRNYCRKHCKNTRLKLIPLLTIEDNEYKALKKAFQGGFTHANALSVGKLFEDVYSCDFTSSYPAVMVAEKYPMSKGRLTRINSAKQFSEILEKYCAIIELDIKGLRLKGSGVVETPLSSSFCQCLEGADINNGRVVKADRLICTLTDVDYKILRHFYSWESCKIGDVWVYDKAYLPTELIHAILKLYKDKTELKGVEGKETEYQVAKGMLNAIYGMCVTDIVRDDIEYIDDTWTKKAGSLDQLHKHNNSKNRFLFYPWGVWVAAYARYNLFTGISNLGHDYIYSDTDSVKFLNYDNHKEYFEKYNDNIVKKLQKAMEYHKLPFDMCTPKTVKGVVKVLGVWDYEGKYDYFKTLGAKRYMTYQNGKLSITVSGINKKEAVPYLMKKFNNNVLDVFSYFENDKFVIEAGHAGKQTHTYIDDVQTITVTDYLGNIETITSHSGIHLEEVGYELSLAAEFASFLERIRLQGGIRL